MKKIENYGSDLVRMKKGYYSYIDDAVFSWFVKMRRKKLPLLMR